MEEGFPVFLDSASGGFDRLGLYEVVSLKSNSAFLTQLKPRLLSDSLKGMGWFSRRVGRRNAVYKAWIQ